MMKYKKNVYEGQNVYLQYYEIRNGLKPLVLLHAQAVDSTSYFGVMPKLAQHFHVYAVDCYGHGGSLHDASKYNVTDIGNAVISFIQNVIQEQVCLLGHSSGGLIAAYIASHSDLCSTLVLEDAPFFSCQGERRKHSFNYVDLSTVCHNFLNQKAETDFVLYYFSRQRILGSFPRKNTGKAASQTDRIGGKVPEKTPRQKPAHPILAKSRSCRLSGHELL